MNSNLFIDPDHYRQTFIRGNTSCIFGPFSVKGCNSVRIGLRLSVEDRSLSRFDSASIVITGRSPKNGAMSATSEHVLVSKTLGPGNSCADTFQIETPPDELFVYLSLTGLNFGSGPYGPVFAQLSAWRAQPQWEYEVKTIQPASPSGNKKTDAEFKAELNISGEEGWELVWVNVENLRCVFKRPKSVASRDVITLKARPAKKKRKTK